MGELVELTTIPTIHRRKLYKFTSKSLTFSVKPLGCASIGLSPTPSYGCTTHKIFINKDGHTGLIECGETTVQVSTPDIHNTGFSKFWLTWYSHKIELGKFGESEPIFSKEIISINLIYATFSGSIQRHGLQWKFVLPPSIERPTLKPIEGGKPYWVPYDGLLPYGALIGGYENEFLYIMRAPHVESLTPGKFVPSMRCGFIGWGGQMHLKTEFEILCAHDCVWVSTTDDNIPAGAIAAGYTEYGPETMYIGRARHNNHIIPGKVAPTHRVCYMAYNDEETYEPNYEILVAPYSSSRCINTTTIITNKYDHYVEHDSSEESD